MACQTRSLVAGMSRCRTPSGARAFMTALMTTGRAPTVPASPAPLAPRGVVAGGREGVLHEGGRQELAALGVVLALLHERLAHPLGHAPVDLPLERERVDDGADVVHDDVAAQRHGCGRLGGVHA